MTPKKMPVTSGLLIDAAVWITLYLAVVEGLPGAENLLTFTVSAFFVLYFMAMFTLDKQEREYLPRGAFWNAYGNASAVAKMAVYAWVGWGWLAAMALFNMLIAFLVRNAKTVKPESVEAQG